MDHPSPLHLLRSSRWERALFGTYALSLGFFEAGPLPALKRGGARQITILADVIGVAAALGEAGAREVGRTYSVQPVRVTNGCFHPKFMLLEGAEGVRLAVGSGNLTFGGWGRNIELIEILSPEAAPAAFLDMADFLQSLITSDRVRLVDAAPIEGWITSLRATGPERESSSTRLLHNVNVDLAQQLLEEASAAGGAEGMTVAAPYFGGGQAVRELAAVLEVSETRVHVADKLAMNGHHFSFEDFPLATRCSVVPLVDTRARPLHAKLLELRCQHDNLLMSGSANGSAAALTETKNVELVVVRSGTSTLECSPFVGPLPSIDRPGNEDDGGGTAVLSATLTNRCVEGLVLSPHKAGSWSAALDAEGRVHELGLVEVSQDGHFQFNVDDVSAISLGRRRAVLTFRRGEERIRGFLAFPELLELNRRWGSAAGTVLRIISGSEEDEDLAGLLEYFAQNPEQTAQPWRSSGQSKKEAAAVEETVDLERLEVRPGTEQPFSSGHKHGSTAIDSFLAALRQTLAHGSPKRSAGPHAEAGDETTGGNGGEGEGERTQKIFERICAAFAERVPAQPAVELHRLADLGLCVLARRPDSERVADFAAWWSALAVTHLRHVDEDSDLARATASFILLDGFARQDARNIRSRLARMVDDVDALLDTLADDRLAPRLVFLLEQATAGLEAFATLKSQVRKETTAIEQVAELLKAARSGAPLPACDLLQELPEMRIIRRMVERGRGDRLVVVAADTRACPICSSALPTSELHRLTALGVASAANCCGRPLLVGRET